MPLFAAQGDPLMELRRTLVWSVRVFTLIGMLFSASTAFAAGALTNLVVAGLSPAFDPNVTSYTVPLPANCSVAVTATLATPTNMLYIQSNLTTSGAVRNAYVCGGKKIDIIVYKNWTEVGRYTITPVNTPPPPPPPPPPPSCSFCDWAFFRASISSSSVVSISFCWDCT